MPVGFLLFLIFLGVPLAEITAFIVIGGRIGIGWTLAMVVVTAVIGSALLRIQSFAVINTIRQEMDAGRIPGAAIGHGAMILVAGLLLLTPGFVTDAIGFLLFVPPIRGMIWRFIRSRMEITVVRPGPEQPRQSQRQTIDLDPADYTEPPDPSSPWRQK